MFGKYPVKFAKIDVATTGSTALVSAVTNRKIRAISLFLVAGADVAVKFQSNSTDKTGDMGLAANGGMSADSHVGLFETAPGEALNIDLSGNVQVGGSLAYIEIEVSGVTGSDLG
jgi:hypothetical protein